MQYLTPCFFFSFIVNVRECCSTFILLDFFLTSIQLGAILLKIYPGFEVSVFIQSGLFKKESVLTFSLIYLF